MLQHLKNVFLLRKKHIKKQHDVDFLLLRNAHNATASASVCCLMCMFISFIIKNAFSLL